MAENERKDGKNFMRFMGEKGLFKMFQIVYNINKKTGG